MVLNFFCSFQKKSEISDVPLPTFCACSMQYLDNTKQDTILIVHNENDLQRLIFNFNNASQRYMMTGQNQLQSSMNCLYINV